MCITRDDVVHIVFRDLVRGGSPGEYNDATGDAFRMLDARSAWVVKVVIIAMMVVSSSSSGSSKSGGSSNGNSARRNSSSSC